MMAGQAEPPLEQLTQARLDATERRIQLLGAERLRDDDVRLLGVLVLDQVAVEAVAARDRSPSEGRRPRRSPASSPTRCSGRSASAEISAIVGSRFSFWASVRRVRITRRTWSETCTGKRISLPGRPGLVLVGRRIHQVAYVESL